jgi:hypothetical protein
LEVALGVDFCNAQAHGSALEGREILANKPWSDTKGIAYSGPEDRREDVICGHGTQWRSGANEVDPELLVALPLESE